MVGRYGAEHGQALRARVHFTCDEIRCGLGRPEPQLGGVFEAILQLNDNMMNSWQVISMAAVPGTVEVEVEAEHARRLGLGGDSEEEEGEFEEEDESEEEKEEMAEAEAEGAGAGAGAPGKCAIS